MRGQRGCGAMHGMSVFRRVRAWAPGRRRLAGLCVAGAAALLAAGCSSSGGTSGASTTSSAGASSAAAVAAPGGATAGCVAKATARANAARAPMTLGTINKVDTAAAKGKTFAVISETSVPDTVAESAAMQQALALVGAKTLIFNGQGLPDVITQDFQSAVTQHVAGIVTLGIAPTVFPSAYAVSKAAGVPVVAANTGDPQIPLVDSVAAVVTESSVQSGAIEADYALAHTGCKLHAAVIYSSTTVSNADLLNALTAEVKSLCPTNCTVDPVTLSLSTFPTTLAGQVQTTLQHSPDINYLISAADSFVPYMLQGRNTLGSTVPVIGATGTALAQAIAGDGEVADVEWPPYAVQGYFFADAVMGAAAGTPKNQTLPVRLVDSSNWGTSDAVSTQFPDLAGYEAAFKKAWGL
jgi:ribose transport system substrate-binding protein